MAIWHQDNPDIDQIVGRDEGTMIEHVGIEVVEIGDDFLKARMPVDHRTVQPQGRLHGGASCVLAETVGSIAGNMVIDSSEYLAVGLDINANHIRPVAHAGLRLKESAKLGFETAWAPKGLKGSEGLRLAEFGNLRELVDQLLGR